MHMQVLEPESWQYRWPDYKKSPQTKASHIWSDTLSCNNVSDSVLMGEFLLQSYCVLLEQGSLPHHEKTVNIASGYKSHLQL